MSGGDKIIVCRRCGEVISTDLKGCPHCGASIQGLKIPTGAVIVGVVMMAASITRINELLPYLLLGLLITIGGAYFIYDRYSRRRQARERTGAV